MSEEKSKIIKAKEKRTSGQKEAGKRTAEKPAAKAKPAGGAGKSAVRAKPAVGTGKPAVKGKPAGATGKPAVKTKSAEAVGKPAEKGKPAVKRKPAEGTGRPAVKVKPAGATGRPAENAKPAAGTENPAVKEKTSVRPKPAGGSGRSAGRNGKPAAAAGRPAPGRKSAGGYGKSAAVRRPAGAKPAAREKTGEMEGLAARRAALKVLREVTEKDAYASLILDQTLQGSGLSGADRRLASRLVYDTLDHLIWLDHMLSQVMAREDTDIKLRNILRLGACQILLMDRIPESAATNTCVELCVENGMEGLKGVCNGILRNLVRKKDELTLPDPETEPDRWFSVKYSVPEWMGVRLRRDWGEETAVQIASWRSGETGSRSAEIC